MIKKLLILCIFVLTPLFSALANWEIQTAIKEYQILHSEDIELSEEYKINLSKLDLELSNKFPNEKIIFEWISGEEIENWRVFKETYKNVWIKNVTLNIYSQENESTRTLLHSQDFRFLVYDKTIPLIISSEISDPALDDYVNSFKVYGIKIDILWRLSPEDLELFTILPELDRYNLKKGLKADYVALWWGKDFVFDIISKLSREIQLSSSNVRDKELKYSLYVFSTFNINVLSSYLDNFLWNKPWIDKLIIASEHKATENAIKIAEVQKSLEARAFDHIDVNLENTNISKFKFISEFISNFSNKGYDINSIYIILIIPFILTVIAFFKHFIGLWTTWILVPLFLVILSIKVWIYLTLLAFVFLVVINLWLSRITARSTLLYTPKITFLITFNLLLFILWVNILEYLGYEELSVTDSIYMVLFVLISERLIWIITSKEFWEYKMSLLNTIIVFLFCYAIFTLPEIKVLLLAYPEILIILLPLNFLIWKFTGLRVTEYFRFREIIRNIEE